MLALKIAICIILLFIAYQDFRVQAVSWWAFPLLFTCFFILAVYSISFQELILNFFMNILFIFLQFIFIFIFFSLRHRKFINLINTYIGIGDLFFFICLCLIFSPLSFIIFINSAFILILALSLIIFKRNIRQKRIPLAGALALCMLVFMIFKWCFSFNTEYIDFISPEFLMRFIYA